MISLVVTISGKSLKLLPPDIFFKLICTKLDFGWGSGRAYSAPPGPVTGYNGAYF